MITPEQIQSVVEVLVDHFEPDKIVLFGSYADGTATEQSDIDLLVIKDTDLPKSRRLMGLGRKLTEVLVHPMDILVYTPAEVKEQSDFDLAFVTRILREGKVLYEH
ncbi:MAG: nucleotidyltransferase domain-containing protein [Firmicutes bacterium]|nr:nucleotidyltransferase domain-containing protein [Bacillota bacterium]